MMQKKYNDLFRFSKKILKNNIDFFKGQFADSKIKRMGVFHYNRAYYLLDAVTRLCKVGYAPEAMIILRSLLNLDIVLKWILKNPSERINQYINHDKIYSKTKIFDMAKDINFFDHYEKIYRKLSEIEHTNAKSFSIYLQFSEKNEILIKTGSRDDFIDLVLISSIAYFLEIKFIIASLFQISNEAILKREKKIFNNLKYKYMGIPIPT